MKLPYGVLSCLLLLLTLGHVRRLYAQTRDAVTYGRIVGTAFDSVHGVPLAGALVTLRELHRSVISDSAGAFAFDSVPSGAYTVALMHDAVDSVGAPAIVVPTAVSGHATVLAIAIPSLTTYWRSVCGSEQRNERDGLLFGFVRDASSRDGVRNATVVVESIEVGLIQERLTSHQWRGETQTDGQGYYAFCGVPIGSEVRLTVSNRSIQSGVVVITGQAVAAQNLYVDAASGSEGVYGAIEGIVVDEMAVPFRDVWVRLDGGGEVKTDSAGVFAFPRAPLGTRQLYALALGAEPLQRVVHITASSTAYLTVVMRRATILDPVSVTARSARQRRLDEIAERRALRLGVVMDSTKLTRFASLAHAIRDMVNPRSVCRIFIDGRSAEAIELNERDRRDIAVIEALRGQLAPMQFRPNGNCIVLLVWTKVGMP